MRDASTSCSPGSSVTTPEPGRPLGGALLIDKPEGPTSHDVVARVRRALRERAVGHTGTLDPFASGLLVVLTGRCTRLARFVEGLPKRYAATMRLGVETDTDDRTGARVGGAGPDGPWPSRGEVEAALARFTGAIAQVPSAYSAKHVDGRRAYDVARRGGRPVLVPVPVTVHELAISGFDPPDVRLRAVVSAGTYVRALARDVGRALGCGAHLTALRRLAIGPLGVEAAVPLEGVAPEAVRPAAEVLGHLPAVTLEAAGAREVSYGRAVAGAATTGAVARLMHEGRVVGVAEWRDGAWRPVVVLEPA